MNFSEQIMELEEKVNDLTKTNEELKGYLTMIKSTNSSMKRAFNTFDENNASNECTNIFINNMKLQTYDFLQNALDISNGQISTISSDIMSIQTDVKKYNKAIETLKTLTENNII